MGFLQNHLAIASTYSELGNIVNCFQRKDQKSLRGNKSTNTTLSDESSHDSRLLPKEDLCEQSFWNNQVIDLFKLFYLWDSLVLKDHF